MLALKLALVAASVLLATLAARRWGHRVSGTLAGFPVVAAPIMLFVLAQQPGERAAAIALATLACLPATALHLCVFAAALVRGAPWWAAFAAANAAFLGAGALLAAATPGPAGTMAASGAALAAGVIFTRGLARRAHARDAAAGTGPVTVPRAEVVLRMGAAMAMAAAVMWAADHLAPGASGLLLAIPIAGNVLPCFTAPRFGAAAAAALLAGFARGLFGFWAFFAVLMLALPLTGPLPAAALALLAASGVAWVSWRWRARGPAPRQRA